MVFRNIFYIILFCSFLPNNLLFYEIYFLATYFMSYVKKLYILTYIRKYKYIKFCIKLSAIYINIYLYLYILKYLLIYVCMNEKSLCVKLLVCILYINY